MRIIGEVENKKQRGSEADPQKGENNMKYFIKDLETELYYRDFILETWEDQASKAHLFEVLEDARIVKEALIKEGFTKVIIKFRDSEKTTKEII
jgi:hypothetical protein